MSIKRNLNNLIDHLIVCYASKNDGFYQLKYEELDEADKGHVVQLMIELGDRDLFSVYENKNYDDIVSDLMKYLANQSEENGIGLATSLRDKICDYYTPRIQEMIDDRCALLDCEELYSAGYHYKMDRDTGEYEKARL